MSENFQELRLAAQAAALRGCSMFADLSPGDLDRIAALAKVRRASGGDYFFHEGDAVRGFFIIRRGTVNVHASVQMGRRKRSTFFTAQFRANLGETH